MDILTPQFIVLIPIVMGIVEAVKQAGLPSRFSPAVAILLGVAGAVLAVGMTVPSVIAGIVVGLTSSGLYSGTKATVQG